MLRVTASQYCLIGEPRHTEPPAAGTRHGLRNSGSFGWVRFFNTLTEGPPTPRKAGNLRFQP